MTRSSSEHRVDGMFKSPMSDLDNIEGHSLYMWICADALCSSNCALERLVGSSIHNMERRQFLLL